MLKGVSHIQTLAFSDVTQTGTSATLDVNAEAAGIRTIDATRSAVGVTIIATNIIAAMTATGSAQSDAIHLAGGDDRITGGAGGDDLAGGAGNDTFVYTDGKDSHLTGGSEATVDVIQDFGTGTDTIDLSAFAATLVTTRQISATAGLGNFVGAVGTDFALHHGDVVYGLVGTDTYVAADTNADGAFDDHDIVIKLVGDHVSDLATAGALVIS
jgi:hypothetical protein